MADSVIQQIMEAMESALLSEIASGSTLSFMTGEPSKVLVLSSEPENEPKAPYKRYLITLYAASDSFDEEPRLGGRVERFYKIGIACWRKAPRSERKRLFSNADANVGVGIYEFVNLVMDVFRNNTLSGLVNLAAGRQFDTPELQDTGEDFLERVDTMFNVEALSATSGGVL